MFDDATRGSAVASVGERSRRADGGQVPCRPPYWSSHLQKFSSWRTSSEPGCSHPSNQWPLPFDASPRGASTSRVDGASTPCHRASTHPPHGGYICMQCL